MSSRDCVQLGSIVATLPLPQGTTLNQLHVITERDMTSQQPNAVLHNLALLHQVPFVPQMVLFDTGCPQLLLTQAAKHWSNADFLLAQGDASGSWQNIATGAVLTVAQAVSEPDCAADITVEVQPAQNASAASLNTTTSHSADQQSTLSDVNTPVNAIGAPDSVNRLEAERKQILHDIYKYCSWAESAEINDKINTLLIRAAEMDTGNGDYLKDIKRAQRQGERARALCAELEQQFRQHGNRAAFTKWFDEVLQQEPAARVKNTLKYKLDKLQKYHANRSQHRKNRQPCQVISPHVDAVHPHPNNLRHLSPHHRWKIVIDESGSTFDRVHAEEGYKNAGRLVAVAVPMGQAKLPALNDFHATTECSITLDHRVNQLLNQPVGIVGITVKDPLAFASPRWISEVIHLCKLVMRLLPLKAIEDKTHSNQVDILIENRTQFSADVSLEAVEHLLKAELESLHPERYRQLSLKMRFIAKDADPLLAYADLVAHTWFGSSAKERLKRSKWLGHCLLQPDAEAVERLYAALDDKQTLSAYHWYRMMGKIHLEPQHSLLNDMLSKLGQTTHNDLKLWNGYLKEVQHHLNQKDYHPHTLAKAIDWLSTYQPKQGELPVHVQFHWIAARIATNNHLGRTGIDDFGTLLQLGAQLRDEIAPDVAQAYLRVAVTATNRFEFEHGYAMLQHMDEPVALIGRLNYAKRLSSLGQYYSFVSQYPMAERYFEDALQEFEKLLEPQQRQKNTQQTQIYRLLNLIDGQLLSAEEFKIRLADFFAKDWNKLPNAVLVDADKQRFSQHLLLRAMVAYPQALQEQIQDYLQAKDNWTQGEGHPWHLINFWRGWLLLQHSGGDAEQRKQAALPYFDAALAEGQSHDGATLAWIRLVLAISMRNLGIDLSYPIAEQQTLLGQYLPDAPHAALQQLIDSTDPAQLLIAIQACLPFNFK